jgi:hypothetical protein
MRASFIALLALIFLVACAEGGSPARRESGVIHARFAPDARALRELEAQIAIDSFRFPPPLEQEGAVLEVPRAKLAAPTLGLRTERTRTETKTDKAPEPREPAATSEPPEDPYADWTPEAIPTQGKQALRRPPPPLVPRAGDARRPPRKRARDSLAQDIAIGIGGAGLALSALSISASLDGESEGGYVLGGVALGIGVIALGAAVVLSIEDEDAASAARKRPTKSTARVRPSATGLGIDF